MDIELVDDINDVMTSVTDMGEKSKSVVTAPFNDITNKNDDLCPLPKVTSLMSQTSPPSQTVRIDASDPISFLAKVMQHNLNSCGVNVTPFEEFCKQQEEKERKKKKQSLSSSTFLLLKTQNRSLFLTRKSFFSTAKTKSMPPLYF